MGLFQPAQVALQCRNRDASARLLKEGGRQARQRRILVGGDQRAQRFLLGGAHRPRSARDGPGLQVSLLAPLAGQASDGCQRDAEAFGDLRAGLPLLKGIDDALTKIQAESFHDHSIAENQPFREWL
jgi:hypothetical protein